MVELIKYGCRCLIVFAFLSMSINSYGQAKNSIYFEALGNGLVYSLNYDLRLGDQINGFGARLGCGYTPLSDSNFLTIPAMANYLFGNQNHFLEIGAGVVYYNGDAHFIGDYSYDNNLASTINISYRYQPKDGGLLWRIGWTPVFSDEFNSAIWIGAGVGYCF